MLSRLVALPCAVPRAQKPFNPTRPQQPGARASRQVTRVAYSDNTTLEGAPIPTPEATAEGLEPRRVSKWDVDADEAKELELDDLDAAQENLLHWALFDAESQDDGIDEMVDYGKFGDEEYEELFEDLDELYDAAAQEVKIGDKILGTVYEIDDDGAYVEIGQKASGFVPISEVAFTKLKTPLEVLRVGMKREFMVVEDADDFGQTILSLAAMEATVFWQRIRQLQEEDVSVNCTVESANKGGLLVKYGPYEGFIPVSQFGPSITPETMETLIGSELPVKFLEIDEERERLVMSNKRASGGMTSIGVGPNVRIGDVVSGVVQSVKPYGAFVDIGAGTMGLLHVSQISHDRVQNVEKVLSEGDTIKVMILSVDRDRGRLTLTTKKLEATPGDMIINPALVFEKADEMAVMFRERMEAAESSIYSEGEFQYPAPVPAPEA